MAPGSLKSPRTAQRDWSSECTIDQRGTYGRWLGHDEESKGYFVYDPTRTKICSEWNIQFLKAKPSEIEGELPDTRTIDEIDETEDNLQNETHGLGNNEAYQPCGNRRR